MKMELLLRRLFETEAKFNVQRLSPRASTIHKLEAYAMIDHRLEAYST